MIEKSYFGRINDRVVSLYTLSNQNKVSVSILDFGATVYRICVPDSKGKLDDIALGYRDIDGYSDNGEFMGCVVAPNANRIAKGKCPISGSVYQLPINDNGINNLHTDIICGLNKKMLDVSVDKEKITFSSHFADGQSGLPGNRTFSITYYLSEENELEIEYNFFSDRDTIFNPTQHTYFNLAGADSGNVLQQYLKINADYFTPVDKCSIPTGEIRSVIGTPFDFRDFKMIGKDFDLSQLQLAYTNGYDHNFCLNGYNGSLQEAAKLYDRKTGRLMICKTTQPGLQVYTANFLHRKDGKDNCYYGPQSGICLETQFFPDCPNHPDFVSSIVKAGKKITYKTIYQFMW